MHVPIAITGCSLLTPLDEASGGSSTWEALCAGRRVGERVAVREDLFEPDATVDRSIRLALAAVRKLGTDVRNVNLFCGTSKGPVTTLLAAAERVRRSETLSEMQALHVALGVGAIGTLLRERLGILGSVHTSVAACSSGLHALHRAATAMRRGECERALVVAADASLHPLFQGSFQRLGVLSPPDVDGLPQCEPFASEGKGFFLIEAAAALLLEIRPSTTPLAWVEKTWIGGDSTGLVAMDPQTRSLRTGLAECAVGDEFAFVHAHATGTGHDAYERAAVAHLLSPKTEFFSHKGALGHSLGAAGLLGAGISALAHHYKRTPTGHRVESDARSLTLAQGFGGHIGLLTLRSAP